MNPSSNNIQERIPLNIRNVEPQSPSSAARQRRSSAYRFTDQRLMQHLDLAVSSSETIDALLIHVSRIVNDQSECLALWASQTNEEGHFNTPYLLTDPEGHALWVLVEDQTKEMIDRVSKTKQICSSPIHSDEPAELIVAPVSYASGDNAPIELMIIGCFSSQEQSVLRQQWLVGFVTQTITRWYQHRAIKHQETKNRSLNDTMGLMHALDQTSTISEASLVIANNLRKLCQTEQVAVSFCDNPNRGTLKAISDVEMMDANSESNKIINNACNQAIATGEILCYPPLDGSHAPELLALDKYCKANGVEACIVAPFQKEDGKTIGSVLFAVREDQLKNETFQTYLGRMVSMVSGHLDVVVRANQGLRDVAKQRFAGFRKSKLTKAILFGALALGVLMMVPLPYRVGCECEIQPVMRRFIASPYDGILEKSLTESGKIVKKNEVIAHLDGRQLRMEQSGLRAEYAGAKKRRDSSLAQGDIATSQIARSEMKRHTSKIEIIDNQLKNLEVRSPIDGIVVSGDLEKVEGSPLEMGQTMFEVAPLDEMHAEIGIPESEIQYIEPGMKVAIKLNAFPFKTWSGKVTTIYPRTEVINDESVFVAQVKLENFEHQLRPGMKGSAKITSQWSPIGWNLFHQPWESVRYWLIW